MNREYYLREFEHFDGEDFITFNIVDFDVERLILTVAVTNKGKISVISYDLLDDNGRLYFEFGMTCEEINLDDFEEVEL